MVEPAARSDRAIPGCARGISSEAAAKDLSVSLLGLSPKELHAVRVAGRIIERTVPCRVLFIRFLICFRRTTAIVVQRRRCGACPAPLARRVVTHLAGVELLLLISLSLSFSLPVSTVNASCQGHVYGAQVRRSDLTNCAYLL